jgi:pyruvate formate lyase activating enzyme
VLFEKSLHIAGLQKNSTLDFPGRLAAVIFFAGCNYDCYYCHNRHILRDPPLLDTRDVLSFLEKRRGLLDGVVLSGGEATLQGGLYSFARTLKEMGYDVKLDTNGSRPKAVAAMLRAGLTDYVAVDYKAPLRMYTEICGAGAADTAEAVAETFRLLQESGAPYEVRVTMIPQITEKRLAEMAESLPRLARFVLQLYRPADQAGPLRAISGDGPETALPYTPAELSILAQAVRYAQPNVSVRR